MKLIALLSLLSLISCTTVKTSKVETVAPSKKSEAIVLIMTEKVFNFAPNSSELDDEDKKTFQKIIADILKNEKKYHRIEIIGHSDRTGTEDDNLDISKERTLSILEAMKDSGIDRKKIRTSWLAGPEPVEKPIESCANLTMGTALCIYQKKNF